MWKLPPVEAPRLVGDQIEVRCDAARRSPATKEKRKPRYGAARSLRRQPRAPRSRHAATNSCADTLPTEAHACSRRILGRSEPINAGAVRRAVRLYVAFSQVGSGKGVRLSCPSHFRLRLLVGPRARAKARSFA